MTDMTSEKMLHQFVMYLFDRESKYFGFEYEYKDDAHITITKGSEYCNTTYELTYDRLVEIYCASRHPRLAYFASYMAHANIVDYYFGENNVENYLAAWSWNDDYHSDGWCYSIDLTKKEYTKEEFRIALIEHGNDSFNKKTQERYTLVLPEGAVCKWDEHTTLVYHDPECIVIDEDGDERVCDRLEALEFFAAKQGRELFTDWKLREWEYDADAMTETVRTLMHHKYMDSLKSLKSDTIKVKHIHQEREEI